MDSRNKYDIPLGMPIPFLDFPDLSCSEPRTLTAVDAPAIYDLYRRCDDYFFLQDGEQASISDAETLFSDVPATMLASDQVVVGWWQDSILIALSAVLVGYPEKDDWYLGFLLLDPSLRNRRFGQKIYSSIEKQALAGGVHRILVAVLTENKRALKFWKRQRFSELRITVPTKYKNKEHVVVELARLLF